MDGELPIKKIAVVVIVEDILQIHKLERLCRAIGVGGRA